MKIIESHINAVLFHYIFLGEPTLEIIHNFLQIARTQAFPLPVISPCKHNMGVFWTLNARNRDIALEHVRNLQKDELHPSVHVLIMSVSDYLREQLNEETADWGPSILFKEKFASLKISFLAVTQMLSSLAQSFNESIASSTPIATREYVTLKEIFSFWLAWFKGGIIIDSGFTLNEETEPWSIFDLDDEPITKEILTFHQPPYTTNHCYSAGLLDRICSGEIITMNGNISFYSDFFLRFKFLSDKEIINIKRIQIKPELDNFITLCYQPFCNEALIILTEFVYRFAYPYLFLMRNNNIDNYYENKEAGTFAVLSASISIDCLIHAACIEKDVINLPGFSEGLAKFKHHTMIPAIGMQSWWLLSKPWHWVIGGNLTKNIKTSRLNSQGKIIEGWRAKLDETVAHAACMRFESLNQQYYQNFDWKNRLYSYKKN